MGRYVTPEQYVRTMRRAAMAAKAKGMLSEAQECHRLADEMQAKIR